MDNFTSVINTTSSILNGTTTQGPKPLPPAPPPLGYYGETKEMLWKVIPPIIMVWGTVGNILIFVVLLRQKTKISSTALYLMALAVSDTIVLYTGPLRQWIKQNWDYDMRIQSEASCKIQIYITYASLHCSSWLLVAVTLERALSVVFPHKVRIVSTKRTAMIMIFSMFLFTYGLNIVHLVIMSLDGYQGTTCAPKTKAYLEFRDDVYHWIDFCVAFAAPFILLLIGNIAIIVCLQKSRANQKKMAAARGQSGASSARDTRSVSVLMVALCVIFLLTVTPVSVFQIFMPYKFKEQVTELAKTDPYAAWDNYQFLLFQHAVVNLVSYTNASFNFILYVFSGTKFRKELKSMFMCVPTSTTGVFSSKSKSSSYSKTATTSISATKQSLVQYPDKQVPVVETNTKEANGVQKDPSTTDNFDSVVQNNGQVTD